MTSVTLALTRLGLAAVFAVAGVAKLRDREGTRKALVDFGASGRIVGPVAVALPVAELATAALLLPARTAVYGGVGALSLLALFSVAIAWNLMRGRAPECHCFGQLHSSPASWKTLARNGLLAGLAIAVIAGSVAEPDASGVAWLGALDGPERLALITAGVAAALLALGGAAFLSLMRSYGTVLVRLERVETALTEAGIDLPEDSEKPQVGLEPGTAAPAFWAQSLAGEPVSLETFAARGLPSLLLFTSPRCGACEALLPVVAEWQRDHADELRVVLVSDGTDDEAGSELGAFELVDVLPDSNGELYTAFRANGTPSAVIVRPDGTIGSWVASGRTWIEELVEETLARGAEEGLPPGTPAPALELPTLDGPSVSLESLRGRAALLLFWNPDCGFCRAMHEELIAWEGSANGVTPQLVVVSSGSAESTRAEGFSSMVLIDDAFAAGSAFGANGTPMAVLVDADGRIASRVAGGAEAVLALARRGA
jgi:methylamine dehydrogenase accessory protein MauD